ncbi:MAG: hypothetical protein QOF51_907 [Chloroflexota bacterium]|jgi:Ser-tRNA(Ala) deacylase AlaX|nr:hypothetical protein [Chloroflexota bacterium]
MAGQNFTVENADAGKDWPTAYDVKAAHRALHNLDDALLKRIPVLPVGTRLKQGATYIDLAQSRRAEFTATANMEVRPAS